MLIPQGLAEKSALIFDPVAQLFVLPELHVRSSSTSMLEIDEIFEFLLPNLFIMVLFL